MHFSGLDRALTTLWMGMVNLGYTAMIVGVQVECSIVVRHHFF